MNKIVTVISVIIIIVLSLGLMNLMYEKTGIESLDLPVAKILESNPFEDALYSVVLVIAIFSSALSSGYGVIVNIKNRRTYKKVAILLCVTGIAVSHIGFGNLVMILYPIFGAISIIEILLIERYYRKIV